MNDVDGLCYLEFKKERLKILRPVLLVPQWTKDNSQTTYKQWNYWHFAFQDNCSEGNNIHLNKLSSELFILDVLIFQNDTTYKMMLFKL